MPSRPRALLCSPYLLTTPQFDNYLRSGLRKDFADGPCARRREPHKTDGDKSGRRRSGRSDGSRNDGGKLERERSNGSGSVAGVHTNGSHVSAVNGLAMPPPPPALRMAVGGARRRDAAVTPAGLGESSGGQRRAREAYATVAAGGGYLRAAAVLALRLHEVGATRPLLVLVPQRQGSPPLDHLSACSLAMLRHLGAVVREIPPLSARLVAAGRDAWRWNSGAFEKLALWLQVGMCMCMLHVTCACAVGRSCAKLHDTQPRP